MLALQDHSQSLFRAAETQLEQKHHLEQMEKRIAVISSQNEHLRRYSTPADLHCTTLDANENILHANENILHGLHVAAIPHLQLDCRWINCLLQLLVASK